MSTLLTFSLIATSSSAVETDLSWTPEVILNTKVISDVQISPNNESVLFVVTEPKMNEEKGVLCSRIYKSNLNIENSKPFSTAGVSSTQPRWSPDGEWIAFLSNREGTKNLYLIHSEGGEAVALTKTKHDIQTFSWSPDGKKIAFVMSDETHTEKNKKKTSLAYVYMEESSINRLWLIDDVFSSQPIFNPLTSDEYCVRGSGDFGTINTEFDWSPDSKQITFAYSPSMGFDDYFLDSSLATLDVDSGEVSPWKKLAAFEAMPRYSPNGDQVAYLTDHSTQRYSLDRQIAIRSSEGKFVRILSSTFNHGPYISGPNLLGWTKDGKHLLFFEPKNTKFHLVLVPIDGAPAKECETGDIFFKEPALSYDKNYLAFVVQSSSTPPEAFIGKIDHFEPIQVSKVNDFLLSYPKTHTESISWISKDGMKMEGLLTYPIDYEENKQYPLLTVIHGGPMGFFDESFLGTPNPYPIAAFAQSGFFIFRPNPRGSSGYGKKFRCANYHDWGGADLMDILSGIDILVEKGLVDSEKLGVMGWSYGGYMTAWAVTQTSRFKAASIGAGLTNLVSMNGITDLYRFLTDYLGNFANYRELYEQRSPINYAFNVTTPCLIQHGTYDKRVPVSQAYEFYHALNRIGKETMLVLYPGMEHRLSDPKMQLDAMERNLSWFKHHLLTPEFNN